MKLTEYSWTFFPSLSDIKISLASDIICSYVIFLFKIWSSLSYKLSFCKLIAFIEFNGFLNSWETVALIKANKLLRAFCFSSMTSTDVSIS